MATFRRRIIHIVYGNFEIIRWNPCLRLFTCVGCIDVDSSPMIYSELARAQEDLVLTTELHLLYLVTPPDLRDSIEPDWMTYFKQVKQCTMHSGFRILLRKNTAHFHRPCIFLWHHLVFVQRNPRDQRTSVLMTDLSNVSEDNSTCVCENVGQDNGVNSSDFLQEIGVVVKHTRANIFLS